MGGLRPGAWPATVPRMTRSHALSPIGRVFAVVALIEAFTWAGLLVGMVLKYGTGTTTLGVWWFGRLHGAAFLAYLAVALVAALRLRWPWWAWLLAILAALPPLATLPLERWYRRRGLLAPSPARA